MLAGLVLRRERLRVAVEMEALCVTLDSPPGLSPYSGREKRRVQGLD